MKVKYFRPDIFELDNLNITPSVIQTGQLVQAYMPVDRTGNFNPFDMTYDPIPKVVKFNKSWEECCMDAAKELWKLGLDLLFGVPGGFIYWPLVLLLEYYTSFLGITLI